MSTPCRPCEELVCVPPNDLTQYGLDGFPPQPLPPVVPPVPPAYGNDALEWCCEEGTPSWSGDSPLPGWLTIQEDCLVVTRNAFRASTKAAANEAAQAALDAFVAAGLESGDLECRDCNFGEIEAISLGIFPTRITTAAGKVFACGNFETDHNLSVIDVATDTVSNTMAVGTEEAKAICANSDESFIYVLVNENPKKIYEIDPETDAITRSWSLPVFGGLIFHMIYDPVSNSLVIVRGSSASNNLIVFHLDSETTDEYDLGISGDRADGVLYDPNQNAVYILSRNNATQEASISKFDCATGTNLQQTLISDASSDVEFNYIFCGANNTHYATAFLIPVGGDRTLLEFNPSDLSHRLYSPNESFFGISAFDSCLERMVGASEADDFAAIFDPIAFTLGTQIPFPLSFAHPLSAAVCLTPRHGIYITDDNNGVVYAIH